MIAVMAVKFCFQPTELLNFTDEDLNWWFDRLEDYTKLEEKYGKEFSN